MVVNFSRNNRSREAGHTIFVLLIRILIPSNFLGVEDSNAATLCEFWRFVRLRGGGPGGARGRRLHDGGYVMWEAAATPAPAQADLCCRPSNGTCSPPRIERAGHGLPGLWIQRLSEADPLKLTEAFFYVCLVPSTLF